MSAWERAYRLPLGAEIALAFASGAATFVLAAVALEGVDTDAVLVLLGVVYVLAVIATARLAGISYAVPVAMAGLLAYDWYYLPRRTRSSSRIPPTWSTSSSTSG
jgi:K+-sensing histidine kinase KdpD